MMQDSIDFGTMNIPKLFRMMFIPTLLGMILSATINIADGIFVGRGDRKSTRLNSSHPK